MEVAHLTMAFQRACRKRKRLTGPSKWEEKLQIPSNTWAHLAKLYTSPMVTARDTHLHFKHITHRRVGTYNRFPTEETLATFHYILVLENTLTRFTTVTINRTSPAEHPQPRAYSHGGPAKKTKTRKPARTKCPGFHRTQERQASNE